MILDIYPRPNLLLNNLGWYRCFLHRVFSVEETLCSLVLQHGVKNVLNVWNLLVARKRSRRLLFCPAWWRVGLWISCYTPFTIRKSPRMWFKARNSGICRGSLRGCLSILKLPPIIRLKPSLQASDIFLKNISNLLLCLDIPSELFDADLPGADNKFLWL